MNGGRRERADLAEPVCIVCGELLDGEADVVRCANCETPHHRDCWEFQGVCAVYGCGSERSRGAEGPLRETATLFIEADAEPSPTVFRVAGAAGHVDLAHLALVVFPLLWLPATVNGGWLCALNLLFISFPLFLYAFQVRTIGLEREGLRLGYLLWSRFVPWAEIRDLAPNLHSGYVLDLESGGCLAIPAQPGELNELEAAVRRHLRERRDAAHAR